MVSARPWLAAFLALAALGPTALARATDLRIARLLSRLPHALLSHATGLALVAGAPLVGAGAFGLLSLDRGLPWRATLAAWGLWLAAVAVEVGCKALGVGGAGAPVPLYWLSAAGARHLAQLSPALVRLLDRRLPGTFPSGHVLRLTLAAGYLRRTPDPWLPAAVAVVAGILIMASGAHHLTGVLGGACLALAALGAAGRLGSGRRREVGVRDGSGG